VYLAYISRKKRCHKYSPYETVPSHRSGMLLRNPLSRVLPPNAIGTTTQVATPRNNMSRIGYSAPLGKSPCAPAIGVAAIA
jgi:hypothetical protein